MEPIPLSRSVSPVRSALRTLPVAVIVTFPVGGEFASGSTGGAGGAGGVTIVTTVVLGWWTTFSRFRVTMAGWVDEPLVVSFCSSRSGVPEPLPLLPPPGLASGVVGGVGPFGGAGGGGAGGWGGPW